LTDAFSSGDGVAFLLGLAPDHLFDLVTELCDQIGAPPPVRYGATAMLDGRNTLLEAVRSVYGKPRLPFFDLFNADFVINFGANFMESWLARSPTAGRTGISARAARPGNADLLRTASIPTSGNADEWYPAYPGSEGIVAAAIGNVVAGMRGTDAGPFDGYTLKDAADASGIPLGTLETIASRFAQSPAPLALPGSILAGAEDGLEAVRAVLLLNQMVGNTDNQEAFS
jgi:molybdopterin-containing oxidoreductase family iron-sulfur binding subunit